MKRSIDKDARRRRIHVRIRERVEGTPERPRLAVFRSLKHIYAQVIDDRAGRTIVSASSDEKTPGGNASSRCSRDSTCRCCSSRW